MSQKSILIVESPTKVKTIQKYLNEEYDVISCVGHVKDLPSNELGIDVENDFEIKLSVLPDKKKFISELRKKSKKAPRVLIATDPDREGEAIAAHLATEVPEEKMERGRRYGGLKMWDRESNEWLCNSFYLLKYILIKFVRKI